MTGTNVLKVESEGLSTRYHSSSEPPPSPAPSPFSLSLMATATPAKRVGTHNGSFHCDEALGCKVYKLVN
ncbi:unnamed protein product [Prunus armeniaca]